MVMASSGWFSAVMASFGWFSVVFGGFSENASTSESLPTGFIIRILKLTKKVHSIDERNITGFTVVSFDGMTFYFEY